MAGCDGNLLTPILVFLVTTASLSDAGKLTCQSFSGSPLRTISRSSGSPLYLSLKSILNSYICDAPSKPCVDATYIPEPFEVTEKSSVILHKQYEVYEDTGEDEDPSTYVYNVVETPEDSLKEFENNYTEIEYLTDIDDEGIPKYVSTETDECDDPLSSLLLQKIWRVIQDATIVITLRELFTSGDPTITICLN